MRSRALIVLGGLVAALLTLPTPAQAAARVSVANPQGSAAVDPTYATALTLRGSGFQSIQNGHGGIYVFFGTVKGTWRPSQGGQTGRNLFYVPDSESRNNQGYQRFVTFPGSDTAGAANGGSIAANGTWSAQIKVPGATFKARDRDNKVTTVDCRKVTCGIITIGAHGVKNATNETFTPVAVKDLYGGEAPAAQSGGGTTTGGSTDSGTTGTGDETPAEGGDDTRAAGGSALTIDRSTAVAGRSLSFSASGLPAGDQVVATLDDGIAAVGPLAVGDNGQVAGTLELPADLAPGTHTLRLTGTASEPSVSFGVTSTGGAGSDVPWGAVAFAVGALLLLVVALLFSILRLRRIRRKDPVSAA